jgi:drug/metabolite transporter (DMT)-like permease
VGRFGVMSARAAPPSSPSTAGDTPAWQVWAGLWTIYVIWGSTYLAIRIMVRTVPPLLGGGLRFALAGAGLLVFLRLRAGTIRVTRRQLVSAAVIGTLLAGGGNGLVTVAEQHVPSSLAALLIASVPLWIVVLRALAGERVGRATLVGVAIGFCGVALLLLPGEQPAGARFGGLLLLVLAAISWATGSFASSRVELPADPLVSTGYQMTIAGLVMVIIGALVGELGDVHWGGLSAESLGAFAYLIVIGSIVAYSAYTWLLQHAPVSKVSTYAYVNPVIAVFLGWIVLSEEITALTLVGAAVIVASVAFTVRHETGPSPQQRRDRERAEAERRALERAPA